MYSQDDLLPISALQHMAYCERQCALIHIERSWAENRYTAEGKVFHERAHSQESECRERVRIERSLPLCSLRLGLVGVGDVVEFQPLPDGSIRPFPIEYKRGKPKQEHCDEIQLCAQAICLEEMMDVVVPQGALFYGKTRHRWDVSFDQELRKETQETAERLHALIAKGRTPRVSYGKKCDHCSLYEICLPRSLNRKRDVRRYLEKAVD